MPSRHAGTITALLITAALFLAMPGLFRSIRSEDSNRMAQSLRPPRMRTLTVWLLPDGPEDRKAINEACAAFEKQNRGARIFLRRVTASEFYGENAVLPDVALFSAGEINRPEEVLIPLAAEMPHASAQHAAVTYAVPLWVPQEGLCYPESWGEDPWAALMRPGALKLPSGVALQRLMLSCPEEKRRAFADAALGRVQSSPIPQERRDGLPPSRGATPTPAPAGQARIAVKPSEGERMLLLEPQTSDRARYAAICRDGEDARAFVRLLATWESEGFYPVTAETVLPNAFAHTRQEIEQVCLDGFQRLADPVLTLMSLR